MVNTINKAVWALANPISIGILLLILGFAFGRFRRIRPCFAVAAVAWFYLLSTRLAVSVIGVPLERPFLLDGRMLTAEEYPVADAILDFGGGVGACTNLSAYAELYQSADRAYFAAALWKAGKAPLIVPSGSHVADSDAKFLRDLGVPERAIVVEDKALNTEENAKRIVQLLGDELHAIRSTRPKVLLVTSAWHMKRSLLMMEKYAPELEVVPAPCDFELSMGARDGFHMDWLRPDPAMLLWSSIVLHEWLGYWGYKMLR